MANAMADNGIIYVGFDGLVPVETESTGNLVYAIKDSGNKLLFGIDDQGIAYFNKEGEERQDIAVYSTTSDMQNSANVFNYAIVLNDNPDDKVMQFYRVQDTGTPDSIPLLSQKYAIPVFKTIMPSISRSESDDAVYLLSDDNGKVLAAVDEDGELLFNRKISDDDHVVKTFDTIEEAQNSAYIFQYALVAAKDFTGGLYAVTDEVTNIRLVSGKYLKLAYVTNTFLSQDSTSAAYAIKDKNGKIVFSIDEEGNQIVTEAPMADKYTVRVFDTVADMKNSAYPFDYAITVGFHSPNDGGGATYRVVTGVSANGMDIHQIYGANRCCQLVYSTTMYVEQFGMKKADENYSIAPIISRMVAVGVIDVRFHAGLYWAKAPTVITAQHSLHISGHDCWKNYHPTEDDPTNPRQGSTCINFRSTRTDEGAAVFAFEYRNVCIENLFLQNCPNPGDPGRIGLYCYMTDSIKPDWAPDVGHYGYVFKRLYIYNFDRGISMGGKVVWDCQFDDVRVSACRIGLFLWSEGNMLCSFRLFYTDHCTEAGIQVFGGTTLCASFWACNFGTYGKALEWYKTDDSDVAGYPVSATFYDCNFETDTPQNNIDGFCVYTANFFRAILTFIGCEFSVRKMPDMPNSTALSFGSHTSATFINCRGLDADNDIARNKFFANRHCLPKTGAITFIGNNDAMPRPNFSDGYEGCVMDIGVNGIGLPSFDTLTNIDGIDEMPTGQQFFVKDEDSIYVKKATGVAKIV